MLKLKDNIKLEELKKYDFKKEYDKETGELDYYTYKYNEWHYILIDPISRNIDVYDDEDLGHQALEKFYDMTLDNLIEKK